MRNFIKQLKGPLLALLILGGILSVEPALAQTVDFDAFGEAAGFSTDASITVIIARLIRTLMSFLGVIAVVFVLYGGFSYMMAAGDPAKVNRAKGIITNAVIGLVIVIASFAITSFIIGALLDATGATDTGSGGDGGGSSTYTDNSSSSAFYLKSANTECAESLMNLALQFDFSKKPDADSLTTGIMVIDPSGTVVDGSFSVSGTTATFTPSEACAAPYEDESCFSANTSYTVDIDATQVESTTGKSLQCTTDYPCSYSFTTGSEVDIADPSIEMDAPEDGDSIMVGSIEMLQALTTDDSGVATTYFYAIDDDEALYSAGQSDSSLGTITGGNVENAFFTDASEWDTAGYTTNKEYDLWAVGVDCAGNSTASSKIEVVLRAQSCFDDEINNDEEQLNCGGDSSSEYYCGACEGGECSSSSDCSTGKCEAGTCVSAPKIKSVSPGDGAPGNLVTISGEGFGETGGTVTFVESGTSVSAYSCAGATQWSDDEIIIEIPSGAADGAILVTTADGEEDQTDDDYGTTIKDFDVNNITRPGLCSVSPDEQTHSEEVVVTGKSLGSSQGSSTLYFTNYEPSNYASWSDEELTVVVPNVNAGNYNLQAFTGDYLCINGTGTATGSTCSSDSDCDESAGESCATSWCSESLDYCSDDDECGDDGGSCTSIRAGSNKISFTVSDTTSSETPTISYVDTGWEDCDEDGSNCEDQIDWGPAGQYVTIYGTGFGSSAGTVTFENESLGYEALGDTDFPDACGDDFWYDTQITVKVPETYQNDTDIEAALHALTVTRGDDATATSQEVDFTVVDDNPTPGICDIDPSSGPASTELTIYGENFGSSDGSVTFYSEEVASYDIWTNTSVSTVVVPDDAATGPITITSDEDKTSNGYTFTVADCREESDICSEGEECCQDGTCSESCEDTSVAAHYAFKISTGITPDAPSVVVECSEDYLSPSPWDGWSGPDSVCVNANVTATFDMEMEESSFTSETVVVEECGELEDDGSCDDSNWIELTASDISVSSETLTWEPPTGGFATDTLHRVTLVGDTGGVQAAASEGSGYLARDYEWTFTTRSSDDFCDVGGIVVSPASYTAKSKGDVDYSASLTAANDACQSLSCDGYNLLWSSDNAGAVIADPTPGEGICENTVDAQAETGTTPATINAQVTDAENTPDDDAQLTINFTDPKVRSHFPDCSTACINVQPYIEFTTDMDEATLSTSTVTLYECEDSLCADIEVTDAGVLADVDYDSTTNILSLDFDTNELEPDTYYRVVLSGDDITSDDAVALSESGSNYEEDANEYFEDDYSWIFKTKDSDISCGVDSLTISPENPTLSYVGERQEFTATIHGEPDDCSENGQTLQSSGYDWDDWEAEDDDDNNIGAKAGIEANASEVVAYVIQDGALELTSDLASSCSTSCLNTGSTVTTADAVCGDGAIETGEDCDDSNTSDGDGCSSSCLYEGDSSTCGDAILDANEECDDANTDDGDGCSSECLNEGSSAVGSVCGDGTRDYVFSTGGEDCDDGNNVAGDGCSAICLNEGSTSIDDVEGTCGNGAIETGEDCDDGNITDGDGCSSSCLNEGTAQCVWVCSNDTTLNCSSDDDCSSGGTCGEYGTPCCGNSSVETGEDCDGGSDGEDGCSSSCLYEGASVDNNSYCGDGIIGTGEECDATDLSNASVGSYGVAQVADGAVLEVDEDTGYAISTISATADSVTGQAELSVECSCTTDNSCGVSGVGCGTSSCCFDRLSQTGVYPANNISSGSDYCRNTAVWVEFDQAVDESTLEGNLYLDLVSADSTAVVDASTCPSGYTTTAYAPSNIFVRAWTWVTARVLDFFGADAIASKTYPCYAPVTFETVDLEDGQRVKLVLSELLEENSQYNLVIVGDDDGSDEDKDGILSENATTLCLGGICNIGTFSTGFKVGTEICELDAVGIEDNGDIDAAEYESASEELFTSTGEEHEFLATAYTLRGASYEEIDEVAGVYDWEWAWDSEVDDADEDDIVAKDTSSSEDSTTFNYTASGNDGVEAVIATATITTDDYNTTSTVGESFSGTLDVTALVCENPWPALDSSLGFPYVEDDEETNFGFYYCRDAGDDGEDDDLPALEDPIDVTSISSSSILQELIFKVEDTSDAIGVRVLPNEDYLSAEAWFEAQEFTGSATEIELDGYTGVKSGSTYYVSAANLVSGTLYPNIYVISYNEDAGSDAADIFEKVLDNWVFNANDDVVEDINLCTDSTGDYAIDDEGSYISCEWDGDCSDAGGDCASDKDKITRDLKRLTDLTDMAAEFDDYADTHGICEVTKGQSCTTDSECPGDEACIESYPDVQSGTFIPALTNSLWGSWNSVLANDLGASVPTDPVNEFLNCDEDGYDEASCWNGEEGTFLCPAGSHVYGYKASGGESYTLYAQLEMKGEASWAYDLDTDSTDDVTYYVEYPDPSDAPSTLQDGFESAAEFCDGTTWGDSSICGDGVQGSSETCEIGDTSTASCTDDDGNAGLITTTCLSDCSGYQTATEASDAGAFCTPYACGNGVVEDTEECDDGELNGTYGFCGDDCTTSSATYCGDGYLAGSEQCDCGYTGLYDYSDGTASDDDANSWAGLNGCEAANGQYVEDITVSCAYNCTAPGPACGDEEINGAEECDGDYEEYAGMLCANGDTCDSGETCSDGLLCGANSLGTQVAKLQECGVGDVCADYDTAGDACTSDAQCDGTCDDGICSSATDVGDVCTSDSDCNSGSCPDFDYELYRYRTCDGNCSWDSWSQCVGGGQVCGNGIVEGSEYCDDGNASDNDACTNECQFNVCGDDHVYTGVESCDDGSSNGTECSAAYGSTCNYCNELCQYKTRSGDFCGDGEVNGPEVCDGTYSTALTYYDEDTLTTSGSCETQGDTTTNSDGDAYTCQWLGVCNGGSTNGDYCTIDIAQYEADGTFQELTSGDDIANCDSGAECVPPVCAANCGSSCPVSYKSTGLLVQSELSGATPTDGVSLYSYLNSDGNSPDNAVLYVPACSVATKITADVSRSGVSLPDVDIIFVTDLSGSMDKDPSGNTTTGSDRRIDYVMDSTVDAIEDLFDAFDGESTLQVGLVSYQGSAAEDDLTEEGYSSPLSTSETALKAIVNAYGDETMGATPTASGVSEAIDILDTYSTADVQIVILLSDGDPSKSLDGTACASHSYTYTFDSGKKDSATGIEACVAEVRYDDALMDDPESTDDILFYSAVISDDDDLISYMRHMSTETCDGADMADGDECGAETYAFQADDAQGISDMYESIVDSIIGTTVTLTTTDSDGNTTSTTGHVDVGSDVTLPFPDEFMCDDDEFTIPLRNVFNGTGAMSFSDFTLTYCPHTETETAKGTN